MFKISLSLMLLFFIAECSSQSTTINKKIDLELIKGNYPKVIALTDSCLALKYDSQLLYKNAIAQRLSYNYKNALTATTTLVGREPDNILFLLEQSRNLINNNQKQDAKDTLCLIFNELDTTNVNAGILLGKIYEHEYHWIDAAQVYFGLMGIDPNNTYFLYHYGIALTKIKKGKKAIPILKKVLELEPDHLNARYLLLRIYKVLSSYELIVAHTDTLKTLTPKSYKPYWVMGNYNLAKNYSFRALPEFLKAVELGYPDDEANHNVGKCYFNIKKYRQALPYLKCSKSTIDDYNLLSLIAECYKHLDIIDSAAMYYEKAYKLAMPDPSFLESYYNLQAQQNINNGDYDTAIECYEKFILQLDKLRWETHYKAITLEKIADIYINNKNEPEKALELYKNILSETSQYSNPYAFNYYKNKIEKLNEDVFFKGNTN